MVKYLERENDYSNQTTVPMSMWFFNGENLNISLFPLPAFDDMVSAKLFFASFPLHHIVIDYLCHIAQWDTLIM